jgi:hypothetical protein
VVNAKALSPQFQEYEYELPPLAVAVHEVAVPAVP